MKIKEASIQTVWPSEPSVFISKRNCSPLPVTVKTVKNFYDYSPEDIVRLNRLALLRRAGFSVEEIRQLFHEEISAQQLLQHRMTQLREEQTRSAFQMDLLQPLEHQSFSDRESFLAALEKAAKQQSCTVPLSRPGMGIRPRLLQIRSGNPGRKAKWLPGLSDFPAETRKTRKKAASNPTIAAPDSAGCRVIALLLALSCIPRPVSRKWEGVVFTPLTPGLGVKERLSGGYRNPPLVLPPTVYRISAY